MSSDIDGRIGHGTVRTQMYPSHLGKSVAALLGATAMVLLATGTAAAAPSPDRSGGTPIPSVVSTTG